MDVTEMKQKPAPTPLSTDDLLLLVDLFYLPYNHGQQAKQIVSDFKWLKFNAIKEDSQEFMELTEQEQKTKVYVCVNILEVYPLEISIFKSWKYILEQWSIGLTKG